MSNSHGRAVFVAVSVVVVTFSAALLLVGWLRPPGHTATTQARYPVTRQEAWDTLTAFDRWAAWYPEVARVAALPDSAGERRLLISGEWGDIPTRLTAWDPPRLLRTEMDGGAFSGSWTWELTPSAGGTLITVTEAGEVRNIFFRALLVFQDNAASMLAFHDAFAGRLGVEVQPVVVGK